MRRHLSLCGIAAAQYLLFFGVIPTLCYADTEEAIQEAFQTELVYPQEKGEFQLTLEPQVRRIRNANLWEVPLNLEYGITPSWQVGIGWTPWTESNDGARRNGGTGDVELTTKYAFMDVADHFHVAVGFNVQAPGGDVNKNLSSGCMEYQPSLMLDYGCPSWHCVEFFTQIGLGILQRVESRTNPADNEPAAHEVRWSSGVLIPLGRFEFSGEFTFINNEWNNHGTDNEAYVTPGIMFRASKQCVVGIGFPVGLTSGSDDYRLQFKFLQAF